MSTANNTNSSQNFYSILKTQLLKNLDDFIRELDISFEYIDKTLLKKAKQKVEKSQTNDIKFKELYLSLYNTLEKYKDNLHLSIKVKSIDLEFLNSIKILDIPFDSFKDEKKNTKKTLVNYLKEFYITSNFLRCIMTNDFSLNDEIADLINKLTIDVNPEQNILISKEKINEIADLSSMLNSSNNQPMNDILGTLNGFMQNKEIMNIATELTNDIQSQKIDPMNIMNSLLTGNLNDSKITSLVSSISEKITSKIANGDIDKNMLEEHANTFMNKLTSNNDLMNLAKNFKK